MEYAPKWIKMKLGMFDGHSFKRLRRVKFAGVSYRDKLTAIWFELLDLAGRRNNMGLFTEEDRPMDITDIAIEIGREDEELEQCMNVFLNEKMIEIQNGIYSISNWGKYQEVDALDKYRESNRKRQAEYRERKKLRLAENNVKNDGSNVTNQEYNVTDNVTSDVMNALSFSYSNSNYIYNNKTKNIDDIENVNSDDKIYKPCCNSSKLQKMFDELYVAYPRHQKKQESLEVFKKLNPDDELFKTMLEAVERWKHTDQWTKENGQYVPQLPTWLRKKRWEDEVPDTQIKNGGVDLSEYPLYKK